MFLRARIPLVYESLMPHVALAVNAVVLEFRAEENTLGRGFLTADEAEDLGQALIAAAEQVRAEMAEAKASRSV